MGPQRSSQRAEIPRFQMGEARGERPCQEGCCRGEAQAQGCLHHRGAQRAHLWNPRSGVLRSPQGREPSSIRQAVLQVVQGSRIQVLRGCLHRLPQVHPCQPRPQEGCCQEASPQVRPGCPHQNLPELQGQEVDASGQDLSRHAQGESSEEDGPDLHRDLSNLTRCGSIFKLLCYRTAGELVSFRNWLTGLPCNFKTSYSINHKKFLITLIL